MIINELVSKAIEIDLGHYKVVRYRDSDGRAYITISSEYAGTVHEITLGNTKAGYCDEDAYESVARNLADAINGICNNSCDYTKVPKKE